jgi:hypothetical protein
MANRKFTYVQDSKLFVNEIIDKEEVMTSEGVKTLNHTKWKEVENEINLGSFKKRNPKVVEIRYNVPPKERRNIFEGLFK